PADETNGGYPLGNTITAPFTTDYNGYLRGRGEIGLGDQLYALLPVTRTIAYAGDLEFDGVDDWLEATDFDIDNDFTISMWVNPSITATAQTVLGKNGPGGEDWLLLGLASDVYSVTIRNVRYGAGTKTTGWQHLAIVGQQTGISDTTVTLYRNGEVLWQHDFAGVTVGDVSGGQGWSLGNPSGASDFFQGRIDEVRIWNGARTRAEIQADMFNALQGDEPGLVAYWNFDQPGPGATILDQTANGNDGTLHGATWLGESLGGYTLYHTNLQPTATGAEGFTVQHPGVQEIAVSKDHPLMLFDLNVSLEWDARKDTEFLNTLKSDLRRASEILFDATNGQVALGNIAIYHNRERWTTAHLHIHAGNDLRPHATLGGIHTKTYTDVVTSNPYALTGTLPYTISYGPGYITFGSVWNRFGETSGTIGEDYAHTLVHELGHYLFSLEEDYFGLDESGLAVSVSGCNGTVMANPYRDDFSEFHPASGWDAEPNPGEGCPHTLQAQFNQVSDWETIVKFYPWLNAIPSNDGPRNLPLAVTQINEVQPTGIITPALDVPIFYLADQSGASYQAGNNAQAILYQGGRLIDLGRPSREKVRTWGARPGDRLCVYEPAAERLGCEIIESSDDQLMMVSKTDWQPEIIVTPVNSVTIAITVSATILPSDVLHGRLFPDNNVAAAAITFAPTGATGVYTGLFSLDYPSDEGYVQVWVGTDANTETNPRREAITSYALGGNPGFKGEGFGFKGEGFGFKGEGFGFKGEGFGFKGEGFGFKGEGFGFKGEGFAPAASSDGQVILFGDVEFDVGQFFALQKSNILPDPPSWATVVGSGYRLIASPNAPGFDGTSLNFRYLGKEVPPGEEAFLSLYHWDGANWQKLPTSLNPDYNEASAAVVGEGLYALMSSIEIPLYQAGWNLVSYPVNQTRPVTEAMASIEGYYGMVYGYVVTDTVDPWKVYAPAPTPPWVNDLDALQFGQGYWISATDSITWYLKGAGEGARQIQDFQSPPATYYGPVLSGETFTPTVGMTVIAWIDGNLCGQGETLNVNGAVMYSINVLSNGPGGASCGEEGAIVHFQVGSQMMSGEPEWNNSRIWYQPLSAQAAGYIYLPLVQKH
ncbi:MAG: LamG domain-containing protein, partial [Anaerolineales bacterium]